jgi:hypothetical protein
MRNEDDITVGVFLIQTPCYISDSLGEIRQLFLSKLETIRVV